MPSPNLPPRQWVPSCFLMMHGAHAHTVMRYCPMHIQRADVGYFSTVKIYGRSPTRPVWTAESGRLNLDDVFEVPSSRVAQDLGTGELFHYGEVYNWTPDMAPPTPNTSMPAHAFYGSNDGSLHGHLASFFIFGAPRSLQRGERYYESFPSAKVNAEFGLKAYILNPFVRPSQYRVHLVGAGGETWVSPAGKIRGKGAAQWDSRESGCPHFAGAVGVIVETEVKTTSFFATTQGGKMVGLDHGHPFLQQVLAN